MERELKEGPVEIMHYTRKLNAFLMTSSSQYNRKRTQSKNMCIISTHKSEVKAEVEIDLSHSQIQEAKEKNSEWLRRPIKEMKKLTANNNPDQQITYTQDGQ
jgi:predicted metal-dependent hydrolase